MNKFLGCCFVMLFAVSAFAQSGASRKNKETPKKTESSEMKITPVPLPSPEFMETPLPSDDDEVIKIDTDLINVPVSVTDRSGRFITDLKREDFQIFDNNKQQQIEYFATSETPFTVALVLDVSLSTKFKINDIQTAAYAFVMQLRPNDKVVLISFDEQIRVLAAPTNDRETLRLAINGTRFGGGTSLYEAMDFTFDQMAKIEGRKAVVLFTDGVDTTSRKSNSNDNLTRAEELDSLIYTIHYDTYNDVNNSSILNPPQNPVPGSPVPLPSKSPTIPGTNIPFPQRTQRTQRRDPNDRNRPNGGNSPNDPNYPNGRTDPNDPTGRDPQPVILGGGNSPAEYRFGKFYLEKLSNLTAGRFYEAANYTKLGNAFFNIAEELRRQYSLGYYPSERGDTGDKRRLKVKVNRPKTAVRAREGYTVGARSAKN